MNWVLHDDKELSLIVLAMKMVFWLSKNSPCVLKGILKHTVVKEQNFGICLT